MNQVFEKKLLTKKSGNISKWYNQVVQLAKLADYAPVRGTMVVMPYGYAIWENVQQVFNRLIKSDGVENAYFPLFFPYSLLKKEKEHVEGFSPELAVVTIGGGESLKEPLVVRPTSEMVMYEMFSKWIKSWKDLPLKINQWNNVVRWEKRTYLFLRTLEFLWQEGHCAHSNHNESKDMVFKALDWYKKIYEEYYAIPVVSGVKSQSEKFAGALNTYAVEALMPDGKALQGATSHDLGQNFSKVLNIKFQDKYGKVNYVWQNSWGLTTRSIGAVVLVHGDDNGLVLPPKVAPTKAAIIPIFGKNDSEIMKFCHKIKETLEGSNLYPGKVEIYSDTEKSFGFRVNEAELRGIPVRIEVGLRELQEKTLVLKARVGHFEKLARVSEVSESLEKILGLVQEKMFEKAKDFLEENIRSAETYSEFKKIMKTKRGFIKAFWCENSFCEQKIKEETKATTRVKLFSEEAKRGKCIYCSKPSRFIWYFAQAY